MASDSRGFAADLAVVPLFAVGEIFLISAFQLLHGTNIWSAGEKRSDTRLKSCQTKLTISHLSHH